MIELVEDLEQHLLDQATLYEGLCALRRELGELRAKSTTTSNLPKPESVCSYRQSVTASSGHEFDVEHGLLGRLSHPNIIRLIGAGTSPRRTRTKPSRGSRSVCSTNPLC